MLPLKDDIPSRRFPGVTLAIILLNCAAFFYEISLGPRLTFFLLDWGLVPLRYTHPDVAELFSPVEQSFAFFTSMFLHGGWMHLLGNMWILWIFGDNVEDRLGSARFVSLYLLGGVAAAILHIATNPNSVIPTIGASGAVAAIMGAYFRFYPHANVLAMIPPFFFGPYFVLPAVFFLAWWFVLQFFNGALSLLGPRNFGGVAWWAHIGGFLFGALLGTFFKARRR